MEITEPVILEIPQGKRRVRVELTTRADARDLIAAIATAMLRLPDDGVPESRHERHEGGVLDADEFRARIEPMTEADLHVAIIYAHSRCPETIEAAIGDEEETRPVDEPEPVSPELLGQLAGAIITGTPVIVTDDEPELEAADIAYDRTHPDPYRNWVNGMPPAPARPVLEVVRGTRSDSDVIPALQVPCPEAHPKNGTLCEGKIPHPMPHRDPNGDEWSTEPLAGAL